MNSVRPRVELLPIFEDNYVFMLIDDSNQQAVAVDPGESEAVSEFLQDSGLKLAGILLTHHHNDHIGGVRNLREKHGAPVYAPLKNKMQIA